MTLEFHLHTDTATLAIFDTQAIRYRLDDTCDWWSLPHDELLEINTGAIAFLNLPSDGTYQVRVQTSLTNEEGSVYLRVPSGQVFIGAGEDTTVGGLEPDGSDVNRGQFITLDKGTCCMRYKGEAGIIHLAFSPSTTCCNHLTDAIRLPMPH